jgi:phenylacetate-coenzyme A ligase PaaK-like adenylate-forming protein
MRESGIKTTRETVPQKTWEKIREVLRFVLENKYSSFYRDKYKPVAFDKVETIRSPDDFYQLPFLSREELVRVSPFKRLFTSEEEVEKFSYTSGTTSSEPLIMFRRNEYDDVYRFHKDSDVQGVGMEEDTPKTEKSPKRALILVKPHQVPNCYSAFRRSKFLVVIGDMYRLQETARLAASIQVTVIRTTATLLTRFIPILACVYDLKKVKRLNLTGERISAGQYQFFRERFPEASIRNKYGLQEVGHIGIPCRTLINQGAIHFNHLRFDLVFGEIIPDGSGRTGELVVTHLKQCPSPLVRYRTGDIIRFVDKQCQCGSDLPLFEVLGRKDMDRIVVGGAEFTVKNFEDALKDVRHYVEDAFEVHFYEERQGDKILPKIIVGVPLKKTVAQTSIVKKMLEESINSKLRVAGRYWYHELVSQGMFSPIEVKYINFPASIHKPLILKKLISHL